jgi:ribonuclease HI
VTGPTASRPLLIHIDGASRGNPGEAGFGVWVEAGDQSIGLYGYLGPATNNVAEYQALLFALRYALKAGAPRVEICSDSELVVRQVTGRYRVKHPGLQPLHREAVELMKRLSSVTLRHVPREANREADRLANRALDSRASVLEA